MKKLVSIIFLLIIGHALYAYPITPRPLRKLIQESPYIVYATVIDVFPVSPENKWSDAKAILVIHEIYQGHLLKDTIDVHFEPNMVCPEPAHYEKGTTVLAFLYQVKKENFYKTYALSYGSKEMTPEAIAVYKTRIKEMQEINAIKNVSEKNMQTMDWLIRCATNPYTRWEGVYELEPESGFMSYYDRGKDTLVSINHLSESQLKGLRQSLFAIDTLDSDAMQLAYLVEKKNDSELLNFLIDKLKKNKLKGWGIKEDVMNKIAQLSNRADLKQVCSKIDQIKLNSTYRQYEEIFPVLSKEFIDLL